LFPTLAEKVQFFPKIIVVVVRNLFFYGVIEVLLTNKYQRVNSSASSLFLNEALPCPNHITWAIIKPRGRMEHTPD
jgi:hypothetical protein